MNNTTEYQELLLTCCHLENRQEIVFHLVDHMLVHVNKNLMF